MDFVERILHISPDHGSGMFELSLLLVVVVIMLVIRALQVRRRRNSDVR